jgi:hypothetical protein
VAEVKTLALVNKRATEEMKKRASTPADFWFYLFLALVRAMTEIEI